MNNDYRMSFTDPFVETIIFSTDDEEIKSVLCKGELTEEEKTKEISKDTFKEIEQRYDLHKNTLRLGFAELVERVAKHLKRFNSPEISPKIREAIANKIEISARQEMNDSEKSPIEKAQELRTQLLAYNKSLLDAHTAIKCLEQALDDTNPMAMDSWIADHSIYLNETIFEKLTFSEKLHLGVLLKKAETKAPAIKELDCFQNLPEDIKSFQKMLECSDKEAFIANVSKEYGGVREKQLCALAHYIDYHRIRIKELASFLKEEDWSVLAPYLRYADLRNCSKEIIEKLLINPSNIEILFISNYEINKLPELPNCRYLNCSGCKALQELPELLNCQELVCNHCKALQRISGLPNCQELVCNHCTALQRISGLSNCRKLYCDSCKALQQISGLSNCRELYCSDCTALQQISGLSKCQKLVCRVCTALQQVSGLPSCQSLYCSGCTALQELTELPNCQELSCNHCTALQRISGLLNCQKLVCDYCTALQLISALPSCQELHYSGCTALQELPELPMNARVYSEDSPQTAFHKLKIDVEKFTAGPQELLNHLGNQFLLQKLPFPNIYYFEKGQPSAAVDVGGVRRDFVVRLFENLFKRKGDAEIPAGFLVVDDGYPEWDEKLRKRKPLIGLWEDY